MVIVHKNTFLQVVSEEQAGTPGHRRASSVPADFCFKDALDSEDDSSSELEYVEVEVEIVIRYKQVIFKRSNSNWGGFQILSPKP